MVRDTAAEERATSLAGQCKALTEMVRRLEQEAEETVLLHRIHVEQIEAALGEATLDNARLRKDYRDFLAQIKWQKAELDG